MTHNEPYKLKHETYATTKEQIEWCDCGAHRFALAKSSPGEWFGGIENK